MFKIFLLVFDFVRDLNFFLEGEGGCNSFNLGCVGQDG